MKYVNYFVLLVLLVVAFVFKDSMHLSTNLLSLFASKESVEKLSIASDLGYTKELLVAVKGFDKKAKSRVDTIAKELKKLDGIELVQYKTVPSAEIQNYYREYYALLSEFSAKELSQKEIREKLQVLYKEQRTSFFYKPIDKNDPLKLFDMKVKNSNFTSKGSYITLGDYGYLIHTKTSVSPSQMDEAKLLYKEIKEITDGYENVIAFAGFFYTVENSTKIKEDVTLIASLSVVILLLMYLVLLRNPVLLSNTVVTLGSSVLFATIISSMVYDNFHIISLAFGASVSGVSIDYLFHYYFHNFYKSKKAIDKNVLYGYLTTTVAFVVLSFIPVPLISQISFFTALALTFAYVTFTFIFKKIELKEYVPKNSATNIFAVVPSSAFLVLSIGLLLYGVTKIKLDDNVRNLDYQNETLRAVEKTFKESNKKSLTPLIVQAKTEDELIQNLRTLHKSSPTTFSLASFVLDSKECEVRKNLLDSYDFETLNATLNAEATKIGFRDGYFQDAYKFATHLPSCELVDLKMFESYNLMVSKREDTYFTMAFVEDVTPSLSLEFVSAINVKEMFKKVAHKMYEDIVTYSLIVLSMILFMLVLSVKGRFLYAINYIFFPVSLTLAVLVTFFSINIMHIFAFIILIAIGIDYGIYMSNTSKSSNTELAIKYSLLSTFGAFGVLAFSSITALNSIGLVISIGAGAIFILLKVMR